MPLVAPQDQDNPITMRPGEAVRVVKALVGLSAALKNTPIFAQPG